MSFSFATCNRRSALGFLKKVYPDRNIEDTPESAGQLLDFVEKDIVRIQDPMMHGNSIQVIPGNNWTEDPEIRSNITEICRKFHSMK